MCANSVILKPLPKVNNYPLGKNSPHLVTLGPQLKCKLKQASNTTPCHIPFLLLPPFSFITFQILVVANAVGVMLMKCVMINDRLRLFSAKGTGAAMLQGCQMVYFQTKNSNLGNF
jgi:hypothetical protein